MKRIVALSFALALIAATAPAALARADDYYTVLCSDGNYYESVDAHAVDLGHKDDAVWNFSENTPLGLTCRLVSPSEG
jgi:hypothetical protein